MNLLFRVCALCVRGCLQEMRSAAMFRLLKSAGRGDPMAHHEIRRRGPVLAKWPLNRQENEAGDNHDTSKPRILSGPCFLGDTKTQTRSVAA